MSGMRNLCAANLIPFAADLNYVGILHPIFCPHQASSLCKIIARLRSVDGVVLHKSRYVSEPSADALRGWKWMIYISIENTYRVLIFGGSANHLRSRF